MSNSFKDLKRSKKSAYDKLLEESKKAASGGSREKDTRFWQPTVDKAGNGYAVIRFLPASKGEDIPWVRLFTHGFQGPGGWYIENSLTTLNEDDPVSEYNSTLWNRGDEAGKDEARKQKRRLGYISNIKVISDKKNPDAEGKVFLFRYGKKIFDKVNDSMSPEFEDEDPINPFDFWGGADFKMKIRKVEGYRNYDKSEFDSPSVLSEDDDELEKIWESQYSLQEFLDRKNFKSYAELKARLTRVLGAAGVSSTAAEVAEEASPAEPADAAPEEASEETPPWNEESSSEGDDSIDFFQKLAAGDE